MFTTTRTAMKYPTRNGVEIRGPLAVDPNLEIYGFLEPFEQGQEAALKNLPFKSNPYETDSQDWKEWSRGFYGASDS